MRVFTSRTLRSTRGRHHTWSNTALFAFAVTRSDEKNAHVFLERVRAATASKSWLLMSVSSGGLVEAAGEDGEGAGSDSYWCCWSQEGGRVLASSLPMRLDGGSAERAGDFVVGGRGVFACMLENHFNAPISRPIDRPAAAIAIAIPIAGCKLAGVCKIDVRASVLPAAPPGCSGRIRPRPTLSSSPLLHLVGRHELFFHHNGGDCVRNCSRRGHNPLFFHGTWKQTAPQRHVLWYAVCMWLVGSGEWTGGCELVA